MPEQLAFNPWLFSGSEQLVQRFLTALGQHLGSRTGNKKLAKDLEAYGEAVSGVAGLIPGAGLAFRSFGHLLVTVSRILRREAEDVDGLRGRIEEFLRELESPMLVVLDDVDRLTPNEIRDVFRLVREVAAFPNVVYLLAYDHPVVVGALDARAGFGNEYLEKIVQVPYALPPLPSGSLTMALLRELDVALEGIGEMRPLDEARWAQILHEVVGPLVQTMRGVKRYAMAVRGTALQVGDAVALADLLGLTAIQVFLPVVARELVASADALTGIPTVGFHAPNSDAEVRRRQRVENLLATAGDSRPIVEAALRLLFPMGARHVDVDHGGINLDGWWRERRLAHTDVMTYFLQQTEHASMRTMVRADQALAVFGDREALELLFAECPVDELADLLDALGRKHDQLQQEHVVPASTAIMNQLLRLPETARGLLTFSGTIYVRRPVLLLLRRLPASDEVASAVRAIVSSVTSLAAQLELVKLVGHREGTGHCLASESDAGTLEAEWIERVRHADVEQLTSEGPHLLEVIRSAQILAREGDPPIFAPNDPAVTVALLRSAVSETHSMIHGDVPRVSRNLDWGSLADAVGGTDELARRVAGLDNRDFGADRELLDLVRQPHVQRQVEEQSDVGATDHVARSR